MPKPQEVIFLVYRNDELRCAFSTRADAVQYIVNYISTPGTIGAGNWRIRTTTIITIGA